MESIIDTFFAKYDFTLILTEDIHKLIINPLNPKSELNLESIFILNRIGYLDQQNHVTPKFIAKALQTPIPVITRASDEDGMPIINTEFSPDFTEFVEYLKEQFVSYLKNNYPLNEINYPNQSVTTTQLAI